MLHIIFENMYRYYFSEIYMKKASQNGTKILHDFTALK